MAANPLLKKMLDAGMQFTEMSQKQAEKLVKEFVKAGQARKKDSDDMVRQIVDRGRTLSEQIVAAVQAELAKQMSKFASRLDEVEGRVEALASKVGLASKQTSEKATDKAASKPAEPATAETAATVPSTTGPLKASPSTTGPLKASPSTTRADSQSD
jgi:polyhydroxyalkanoate synthesis regulator phasin